MSNATTASPRVACIYARVSTQDQSERGFSLPTQIAACQELASQHGYSVPPAYVLQDDVSGTTLRRPALDQLRSLVREHAIQAVIVHDLDRLSRKFAHQLLLVEELDTAGVAFHLCMMPHADGGPDSLLMLHVKGALAEYERAKILARTERGRRGRVQAGFVPQGPPPYGYRLQPLAKGGTYVIHDEEAAIVRRIFTLYVTDDLSQRRIAARLTQEGVPAPGAGTFAHATKLPVQVWHQASIRRLLANEVYLGRQHYGKTQRLLDRDNPDKKRQAVTDRKRWIQVAVPAIIAQDVFDAAQERRKQNTRESPRNRKQGHLLINGRLKCGQCGSVMTGESAQGRYRRYRCGRRPHQEVIAAHTVRSVLAEPIEQRVWEKVLGVLNDPSIQMPDSSQPSLDIAPCVIPWHRLPVRACLPRQLVGSHVQYHRAPGAGGQRRCLPVDCHTSLPGSHRMPGAYLRGAPRFLH